VVYLKRFDGIAVLLVTTGLFLVLGTHRYLDVDGALDCLSVYWRNKPLLGENNHLLFLSEVYAWSRLTALLGVRPQDPLAFLRSVQAMNAIFAGASLALFYVVVSRVVSNRVIGLIATIVYGFSNGFVLHATNSSQPVIGLFLSLASVAVVASGLEVSSRIRLWFGGALLIAAMASYESMVLIGPAEVVLVWGWHPDRGRRDLAWFLGGCAAGAAGIYLPAYASSAGTSSEMWTRFLQIGGAPQIYSGFSLSKVANVPVGLATSLVTCVPTGYAGIRALSRRRDIWTLWTSIVVAATAGWMALTAFRLSSSWAGLNRRRRLIIVSAAVGLLFDVFPAIFWTPVYEKLWLQPLAVIIFLSAVGWEHARRERLGYTRFVPEAVLLLTIVGLGLATAIRTHRSSTPCLDAARDLARVLGRQDLLVAGWTPTAQLYSAILTDGAREFDVPVTAIREGAQATGLLYQRVEATRKQAGNVYFLEILDLPKSSWDAFIARSGLQYDSLEPFRRCARPIATFSCGGGTEILRQLSFECLADNGLMPGVKQQ
jgi:hypothetical protein